MLRVICCALALATVSAVGIDHVKQVAKSKIGAKVQQKGKVTAMSIVSNSLKAHKAMNRALAPFNKTEYRVSPEQQNGVEMKPMPGMAEPAVKLRAPDSFNEDDSSRTYAEQSQLTDLDAITAAIDEAEDRLKGLRLYVVQKENFLMSLRKRDRMLDSDISMDKAAMQGIIEHINALDARLNRLKKEEELRDLSGMYANFTSNAQLLKDQADGLSSARDALQMRIAAIQGTVEDLKQKEDMGTKMAINGEEQLQTYGYGGSSASRSEAIVGDISAQTQQMMAQQNQLKAQLDMLNGVTSGANATDTVDPKPAGTKDDKAAGKSADPKKA